MSCEGNSLSASRMKTSQATQLAKNSHCHWKTTCQCSAVYNMFSPIEEVICSLDCFTCNPLRTPDSEIISLSGCNYLLFERNRPVQRLAGWARWNQKHHIAGWEMSVMSHIGHKLLSMQWWISLLSCLMDTTVPDAYPHTLQGFCCLVFG